MEVPNPPTVTACASCMQPLLWLYSPRTSRWVAFVPADGEHTIRPHLCRGEPGGWPSWRDTRRGSPPSTAYREARAALQDRTEEET